MYRRSLAAIDAHVHSTQASQLDQLTAVHAELSKEVGIIFFASSHLLTFVWWSMGK